MMPWYLGSSRMSGQYFWGAGVGLLTIWSVVWTGLALWHASRREDKGWFTFFLLVHTAGIIEFVYLMFIAKVFTTPPPKKIKRKK